jgi:hypothetical protein
MLRTHQLIFFRKTASVDSSQFIISSFRLLIVAEEAPGVIEGWVENIFHHTNTGGFFMFPWESGKWDTGFISNSSTITPSTKENW